MKVSATTAAEAAGISRMTLHRIERGEPSVTMGAYMNAIAALGLDVDVIASTQAAAPVPVPGGIRVADYPQLRRLGWQLAPDTELTPEEAWGHLRTHTGAMSDASAARCARAGIAGRSGAGAGTRPFHA